MQTIFEAAGRMEGLHQLARAWHVRVMADEVVSHAFSQGFHPQHVERLAAYWAEALGGPSAYSDSMVARPPSSGCTAATGSTTK
jgi:hemoglobin